MPNFYDSWRSGGTGRGAYTLEARTATEVPLTLTGAASQSANYLLIQNSASTAILTINSSGNVTIANDLTVSGSTTISIDEAVTGNMTLTGNLTVNGNSTIGNASSDTLTVTATSTFSNAVTMSGVLTVNATTRFNVPTSATAYYMRRQTPAPSVNNDNGAIYTSTGDAGTTELFYLDAAGNSVQLTDAGAIAGGTHFDDDENLTFGNTSASPDFTIDWETADADAHYVNFAVSSVSRNIIISEDRNIDWTHAAQTNPTLWIQSADSGTVAQYLSFAHDQTNAVITSGTGAVVINATALLPDANDAYALGASGTGFSDLFLASGAVINFLAGDATLTHAAGLLTLNVDLTITGDLTSYEAVNDANPEIRFGATDAEEGHIQSVFDAGAQTLDYVLFQTDAASVTADKGQFIFNVDGTQILSIDDGGLEIDVASGTIIMSGLTISGGTNTFNLTNGTASLDVAAGSTVNIDASLTVSGASTINQDVSTTGNPTFGNLTITSFAANWTNASRTVADLGIVTTVDINGGTIDGTTIGGAAAGAITGTTITANTNIVTGAGADIDLSAGGRLFGGGIQGNFQTLAANTNLTIDENDCAVAVTLGSTSDNTINLPAATGNGGMIVTVFVSDGAGVNNAVVTRNGTDTISNGTADTGNVTVTLEDTGDFVTLMAVPNTGDEWVIIAQSGATVA